MAKYLVEVFQGVTPNWKQPVKTGTTLGQIRAMITQSRQSFSTDPEACDFRMQRGGVGEPLGDEYAVVKNVQFWALKRKAPKKAVKEGAKTSTKKSKNSSATASKLDIELPATASGPTMITLSNKQVVFQFADDESATDFVKLTCEEYGVDFQKAITSQEAQMLDEEEKALQHQLEIIKQKRSQVGSASAATEEEDLQQVVKKKVLTKRVTERVAKTAAAASSVAAVGPDLDEAIAELAAEQVAKNAAKPKTAPFSAPPRPVAVVSAEEEAEEELEEEEAVVSAEEEKVEAAPPTKKTIKKISKAQFEKIEALKKKGFVVDGDIEYVMKSSDEEDVVKTKKGGKK